MRQMNPRNRKVIPGAPKVADVVCPAAAAAAIFAPQTVPSEQVQTSKLRTCSSGQASPCMSLISMVTW